MDPFSPRLLQIAAGSPVSLRPVPFAGRVDELTLERYIVDEPDLVGEPLLVLGQGYGTPTTRAAEARTCPPRTAAP